MCRRIDAIGARAEEAEEVAHLSLVLGRYLLISGADTARVQDAVERFAGGLGFQSHPFGPYKTLPRSVISCGGFCINIRGHLAATARAPSTARAPARIC